MVRDSLRVLDLISVDLGIDKIFNDLNDVRFTSRLKFHVQELGCVKNLGDIPMYRPGKNCADALRDLVRYCRSKKKKDYHKSFHQWALNLDTRLSLLISFDREISIKNANFDVLSFL